MNVPSGNPYACVNMQLEIKPGTQKKFVRNKAIPSRAREPAALAIYAPLSHFHLVLGSAVVDTTFVDIYVDTKNIPTCRYNIQHIDKGTMEK